MGFLYVASFENVAVTAAQDLFSLLPATQRPCVLHACYISQSTELGDAAEEQLRVIIKRGGTTVGSGGTAATEYALDPSAPTASASVRYNDTTAVTTGTIINLHAETFNVRNGWIYLPTPEMRIKVRSAEFLEVYLAAAPTDSVTMGGTLYWEEL
jgi:hypothetical protein